MEPVVDQKETHGYYSIHTDTNEVITRLDISDPQSAAPPSDTYTLVKGINPLTR